MSLFDRFFSCPSLMHISSNRSSLGKTSAKKNLFLSGIAQITSPPPPPNSGKLYNVKNDVLRVLQNQVTMITTMVWVIIVIIILVLLMILVLKMTKKYHITWYWCQNIRDNMVEKRVKKFGQGPPPPLFGQCPKEIDFFYGRCSLSYKVILVALDISKADTGFMQSPLTEVITFTLNFVRHYS